MPNYAGIGSRATPIDICHTMTALARHLSGTGWVLRSGNAPVREEDRNRADIGSADLAFQAGVPNPLMREIYLPCYQFNGLSDDDAGVYSGPDLLAWPQALALVEKYHPAPGKLTEFMRALMARNCFQVLGKNLQVPADKVICYTRNGHMTGGTSFAIRLANAWSIPVSNLGKPGTLALAREWLKQKTPAN